MMSHISQKYGFWKIFLDFLSGKVPGRLESQANSEEIAYDSRRRRSGQSVTASDFGSNGPRFESGRGRCVESLDKALYSHCPKEKPSH